MKTNNVFINPLTDFGFKRVFASEENKDILIASVRHPAGLLVQHPGLQCTRVHGQGGMFLGGAPEGQLKPNFF